MKPLMYLKGDNVLETLLLEATDNEPGASLTPAEEAALFGEDPASQEAQGTTTCPPDHLKETPEFKVTARVVGPWDAWEQIPLPPPGFRPPAPVFHLPPLEDAELLVSIPREAQLDITSLASMEMITVRNTLMGKFKCNYQMQLISMMALHLNPFKAPGPMWY